MHHDGDGIPSAINKLYSKSSIDYVGSGILPESRRFSLIDGTVKDVKFDKNKMNLSGLNGWNLSCNSNPILLFENGKIILIFTEPGENPHIQDKTYQFSLIERKSGKIIRAIKTKHNPRSMMIYKNYLYLLLACPVKKIEYMPLE